MALRKLRTGQDEALRKICKPVTEIHSSILTLLDDMADTMYDADGVGLAAPQVGVIRRVVVIDVGEGLVELINPEILETKGSVKDNEGCLSIPGATAEVVRSAYAKVKALNRDGELILVEGRGLMVRALCHEIDHFDGILYIDMAVVDLLF